MSRAVIFELAVILFYLLFETNSISTTITASQQPQPHLNNHAIPTTAPTTTSPHHLLNIISTNEQHRLTFISTKAAIFSPETANPNEPHLHDRRGDSLVGAGADDFYNVRVLRMISATSAHVRVSRRKRIKISKGAEPAGGEG